MVDGRLVLWFGRIRPIAMLCSPDTHG
jgi:hypothetical protein